MHLNEACVKIRSHRSGEDVAVFRFGNKLELVGATTQRFIYLSKEDADALVGVYPGGRKFKQEWLEEDLECLA